jgi:hypothetical protein
MASTDLFISEAERVSSNRRTDAGWLTSARQQALQQFRERGLPTTRDEDWPLFHDVHRVVERGARRCRGVNNC